MKTEHEIKALPLEERQKLAIELRAVKTGDKLYANAKALLELITYSQGWKEPALIEVKNVSGHVVTVDDSAIAPDATSKVFPWQFAALARFLEPVTKAAALLLLLLGLNVYATTTDLIGSAGDYHVMAVAGLNGGTNAIGPAGVTNYFYPTITTNQTAYPTWTVSNGVSSVVFNTNNTYVTNVPGLFSIVNFEDFTLTFACASQVSSNLTEYAFVDYSSDGSNWQTNKWVLPLLPIGTGQTTTNLDVTGCSGGYGRLNCISNNSVFYALTNIYFEVTTKTRTRGP
jgi:hypothetical protein